jgi:hypothetical protein
MKSFTTVGLNWSETVTGVPGKWEHVFGTFEPSLVLHEIVLIRVQLPGGAAIIFAQSWNFELKFFVGNPFFQKISSMGV